jgi:hypothetical protein
MPVIAAVAEPVEARPPADGGVPGGTAPAGVVVAPGEDGAPEVGVPGGVGVPGEVGEVGGELGGDDGGVLGGVLGGVVGGGVVAGAHFTQNILCLSWVGVPFPVSTVSR